MLHKIPLSCSLNLVQYSNLIFLIIYDNILVSRGENGERTPKAGMGKQQKQSQKNVKNLLTNRTLYDIMCIQGKGNAKMIGCADTNVNNGKRKLPKKVLDKSPNLCYNKYVPKGTKSNMGCDLPQEGVVSYGY